MKRTKKRWPLFVLAILIILIILVLSLNSFFIDYLWFKEVGYLQVFFKELLTKLKLGGPLFLIFSIIFIIYFRLLKNIGKDKNSNVIEIKKKKRRLYIPTGLIVSFILTTNVTNKLWYKILEYNNGTSFGMNDPIFGRDISFYVFKLPLLQAISEVLFTALFWIVISTVIYSVYSIVSKQRMEYEAQSVKDIDIGASFKKFWALFGKQTSIFVAIFFLILSYNYYLKTFSILYSTNGSVFGAGYTDIHIGLPLFRVLMVTSIVCAIISIIAIFRKKIKTIFIGPALLILVYIIGGITSAIVENYIVDPNQFVKEEPYYVHNIEYTRMAYGIDEVEVVDFPVSQDITLEDIENNPTTINNIPVNDYRPTIDMYNSIQGFRLYYDFDDVDVDRYYLDGQYTQLFLAPREMDNTQLDANAQTWINQTLKYTHGFGIVASPIHELNEVGQPELILKDIPPETDIEALMIDEPRIYFGEVLKQDSYAITNTANAEFDYPMGDNNAENFYEGSAGISLTGLNRLAFAIGESNIKFLLSREISEDSKVIIRRNILERFNTITPFLSYDTDPYVIIVEGKIYWIIDAFTLSDKYPYSQMYDPENSNTFNYIRNSVKVVIDAYNGDITYYQVDEDDPLATTYNKIYPDLFKPFSEMPDSVKAHIRYSEVYFDVQAYMYTTYHMTNPQVFYNKEDQWNIANQVYSATKTTERIESTYIIMKLPDRENEEFMMMLPFTPRNKDNMIAWMAGSCDGDNYGKLTLYQFPKQKLVYGPMQIEQRIDQDTTISPQLTLLGQQGSEVIRGNMLIIPIEGSILYVEPIFIQASGAERNLPELKKVIVSFDNTIVMADTLDDALIEIFGESTTEDVDEDGEDTPSDDGGEDIVDDDEIAILIVQANEAFENAQNALQAGDFALYGEYIEELEGILEDLGSRIDLDNLVIQMPDDTTGDGEDTSE